ncbi:MAG: nitrite reductase (NAD(P)H), partial [Micrococcales bacterium]|nr:nitrite reductase (NAD(P)H) [Micrococcales bacterium]
ADLDDDTIARFIDRYLMFYVRTADRLQRTARWQEELDGKIEHVKNVVVKDSLGIAADLEEAMARHIGSYEDEWAATLKDPERLARFRTFVNDVETDDSIRWVAERDQHRPATPEEIEAGLGVPDPVMVAGTSLPVGPPAKV